MFAADSLREVRRLRLTAPDATLAGRARALLDDALRTASLPSGAGRIVLIRRLDLGAFTATISSSALARAIEQRLAAIGDHIVRATDPAAGAAPAVWFRDALEAHVELALRVAGHRHGDAPHAWFWQRAVAAWSPAAPVSHQLRAITLSLASVPEAPTALRAYAQQLASRGHADTLCASLTASDGALLLRASGVTSATTSRRSTDSPSFSPAAIPVSSSSAVSCAPQLRWLETMLMQTVRGKTDADAAVTNAETTSVPTGTSTVSEPTPHERSIIGVQSRPSVPIATAGTSHASHDDTGVADQLVVAAVSSSALRAGDRALATTDALRAREASRFDQTRSTATAQPDADVASAESGSCVAPAARVIEPARAVIATGAFSQTAAGGLLFVLPILARLGYPRWLEASPDWTRAVGAPAVLSYICLSLALPPADPAWQLATPARNEDPTEHSSTAFARAAARVWVIACRRWLRRYARIGLATLVLRPAQLAISPTHVDVRFGLSDVDLTVRRAGLDLTPGWLPWFGRVVSFHYERDC